MTSIRLLIPFPVVHFISTPETAKKDLPNFLLQQPPSEPTSDDIGSQNYSRPAEAFIFGLGYTNDMIHDLRKACEGVGQGVPWLIGGRCIQEFRELVASKALGPPETLGPINAQKQKTKLLEVLREGKGGEDGVFRWYE